MYIVCYGVQYERLSHKSRPKIAWKSVYSRSMYEANDLRIPQMFCDYSIFLIYFMECDF